MDSQELSMKFFVVFSKAYKVMMDRAVKDMKKHGLSENEFMVMELLHHKGRFPLQQIGGKLLVTSGGITYTIDKLEGKGYLRRVDCPEDRRITYAEITEKGSRLMEEVFPAHAHVIHSMMSALSDEEKITAVTILKKLGLSIK